MAEDVQAEEAKKTVITVPPGGLEFRGEDGALLASLSPLKGGGAALSVGGRADGPVAALLWGTGTDAGLTLRKPGGGGVSLTATESGAAMSLDGPDGQLGVTVGADVRGGMCALWGQGGAAATIGIDKAGGGQISVFGADGEVQIGLLSNPEGGTLQALTSSGKTAVSLGASGEDGALIVWDKSGAKAFAVPTWKFTGDGTPPGGGCSHRSAPGLPPSSGLS